jgi:CRP-like cAMP-binding protein
MPKFLTPSRTVKSSPHKTYRVPGDSNSEIAIPLMDGLSASEVEDIFAHGKLLEVGPKLRVFSAGERAEHLFVLLKGLVNFSRPTPKGDDILLRLLTPGDSFGLAALLPDPPGYMATAEAVSESEVMAWKHEDICRLAATYHQLSINALAVALCFLGRLVDRHSILFQGEASHRIARALVDISRRSGRLNPQGIDVEITNEQLGSLADASRFTTSRVLSDWKRKGFIKKEREIVRIYSPEALLSDIVQ